MRLFKINEFNKVVYSEKVMGISAFFKLWNRDTTDDKEQALNEITFIYFIVSMNKDNPFRDYGRVERVKAASDACFGTQIDYKKDAVMTDAISTMLNLEKSATKDYLRDTISNIDKLRKFLTGVNLDERDANNKLIHNPKQYSDILKSQTDLLKGLKEALRMVDEEEDDEETKIRGGAKRELDI
jgi:hypothetical protein